ncbi:hypothetical protein QNH98_01620 [Myroides sp. mNGS23_01]|nr:hypothetical protein [Myroides sp. mNGS23_01]WHT39432.1 hypothetical protein QNH98_01620 [Myroides sp. mNGS23_01]
MKVRIGRAVLGLSIVLLVILATKSMKREVTKADFFIGKYCGVVLFEQDDTLIQYPEGWVKVVKIGNKASFSLAMISQH